MFEELPLYEGKYAIRIGEPQDPFFYFFDYDDRSHTNNMEFQHFHAFYEIFVLLDDEASHIIEGQLYPLSMYDIVCLPPALLHKTQYPVGAPKKRLIINFSLPEAFGEYLPEYRQLMCLFDEKAPIYRFSGKRQQELFTSLNKIFSGNKSPSSIERLRTHHAFIEFLSVLYTNRSKNQYQVVSRQGALSDKIYDICACINANYREPLSLESLAQKFFISPHYLSHQFKQVTHFNLTDYIQRTRIRNAQQALMFSDDQISSISEACGFKSFSQFNRVFHKHCGVSPSQYRKENRPLWEKPL